MTVRVRLIRPDDLLDLLVEAVNMRLDLDDPTAPTLVVDDPGQDAYLAIGFPPQAIVEEAIFDPRPGSRTAPDGVLRSRISGASRLVFTVPPERRIPYTVAGLLDWQGMTPRLSSLAVPQLHPTTEQAAAAGSIVAPGAGITAIELPYRLLMSPIVSAGWAHRTEPSVHDGWTELWHTRLSHRDEQGVLTPTSAAEPAPLRAIWSQDFRGAHPVGKPDHDWDYGPGVLTSMTPSDRYEIVVLTSGFTGYIKGLLHPPAVDRTPFEPSPVFAEQMMLSSLGGWLKSRGGWNPPMPWFRRRGTAHGPFAPGPSLNISEWVHAAAQGRDHYVRIVYEGVVHPFGHRASLIKVTERKIRNRGDGSPVAFLAQREFVVIRQPVMDYSDDRADATYARKMPFGSIRLTTLITPDIDPPVRIKRATTPPAPATDSDAFWITVAGNKFRFNAVGYDLAGHAIDFSTTLVFIPFSSLKDGAAIDGVRAEHIFAGDDRACPVPGQQVTYADPLVNSSTDNTTQVTQFVYFTTENVGTGEALRFRPRLLKAAVRLPAVEQLLGVNAATEIALRTEYIDTGFVDNPSGVFAYITKEAAPGQLAPDVLSATFSADQAGGVATPNLSLSALTREYGPMAGKDLTQIAAGDFKPADFFADFAAEAKVFGTISLIELLAPGTLASEAPKMQLTTEELGPGRRRVVAALTWKPTTRSASAGIVSLNAEAASFEVNGRVERIVQVPAGNTPTESHSEFTGVLTNFSVDLLNVVVVHFKSFTFTSTSGSKPAINVALKDDPLGFEGDLKFVNQLKDFIPPGLFGDGASLDVTPTSVRAGFGIGLPPVSIGIFALEGVSLNASVELPFADGKPLFDFGISSREHPFCLTVAFLGGGGYFHLQLDTQGIRLLEAALEFGAAASVNLGVASGGVHIMAGVYFAMGKRGDTDFAVLSGYLRMGGELSVLGLISISLEFVLSFGYEAGKAAGRATLTVKIEIAFFSKSVEIAVEKQFGGSSGDPRFIDVLESPALWADYASVFV